MSKKKQIITNPLTKWLLAYIEDYDTNLTELSLKAGLSAGSLRSLVKFPERKPSIETCLRLSQVTGRSADEIMQMAGLEGLTPSETLHPDRLALLRVYDTLPAGLRQTLVN